MSASKKHRLAEDDAATDVTAKKAKIENGDAVSEEERKRLKKERKEQRKKDKKAKKEAAAESTEPEVTSEKKVKKDKKEKKEKNEKKDKKKSRDTTEESSPQETSAPEANGHTEQPKNGAVEDDAAQTNGSSGYSQTASLSAVPQSEIESFLKTQQIAVSEATSTTTHRPILEFAQLPSTSLLAKSPFASFKTPTPIQSASWPFSLAGRDVVGIAETGSGKTLAFALPCIEALQALPKAKKSKKGGSVANALAVIVSPTRELAMQTHATIAPLAELVGMSAVCVYGGASKDDQRTLLHRKGGAEIIVATPGRLKDFLSDGTIALGSVRFAVLDEADRMLDKGFEEDIKMILAECPAKTERQTLMFTATWPISVRGLAEGFMTNPVKITIGGKTRAGDADGDDGNGVVELQANSRISQTVEVVDPRNKEWRLLEILKANQQGKAKNDRILVFCLYKKEAMRVETFLQKKGVRVASIHGDLKQEQRTRSLEAFKAGTTTVLVATDVAARGLDIPEVKLVVNVTFPLTIEDYVHRIGRTGRAGKTGQAITLFTEHDKAHSGSLVNILKGANQPVPDDLLKFGTTVKKKGHDAYGAFFKDVDMSKKATKITFD